MDRKLIEIYADGGSKLQKALEGLSRSDLLAFPVPGTWSLQQIAIHLMESDMIASDRIKRIACMHLPLLIGYDETAFSQLPGVDELDVEQAIQVFDSNRRLTAVILRKLPDEAFTRCGIHNEIGRVSLAEMIQKYIDHLDGHLKHVSHKRQLLGRPLTV